LRQLLCLDHVGLAFCKQQRRANRRKQYCLDAGPSCHRQ
jgi:hypothetical protein